MDDHAVRASLAVDAFGLPEVPGPNLDPYLDAAARCFARHGLRRTKVVDIAEEAGVNEVTLFRRFRTKEELLREVWNFRSLGRTRTLDSHACRLRSKLAVHGERFVLNVWGVGYRLVDAVPPGPR